MMSGEGELPFDPTTRDGDGAGAEGSVGGDSAGDTIIYRLHYNLRNNLI